MTEKTTMEKMAQLLLESSLGDVKSKVKEQIDATFTSFEAKLDGVKAELNAKVSELESIAGQEPLTINFGTIETPKKEAVHSQFMKVLNILKSQKRIQKNIMFVGEAGSGKTHLAYNISQALGLKFYPMSVGLQTTKSDLLGFINAHGEYVTSPVREAFEKGGVLLLDEFDSTHAGVVTIINSLLANGHCSFPDKIIEKNDKFICIVACNTYGHGANIDYVGRNRLDGATLDRFIVIDVGYDEKLEKILTNSDKWLKIVNQIRKNIQKQGIKMIVSPRASMNGADLLENGFSIDEVLNMCIFKGADTETRIKCMQGVDLSVFGGQAVIKEPKLSYERDTGKYDTFVIRTEDKTLGKFISIECVSGTKYRDDKRERIIFSDGVEFNIKYGTGWTHQYTSRGDIFFSAKSGVREFASMSSCGDRYIKEFMQHLDVEPKKLENEFPLAFEFIAKGCRNPWKVITMEVE